MKRKISKLTACLAALCMAVAFTAGSAGAESSGLLNYPEAIERLNSISLTDEAELLLVRDSLAAVGSRYFSPQYRMVAEALLALVRGEETRFAELELGLKMLGANQAFTDDYLSHDSLGFLPFDALLRYIAARRLEAEGKAEEAYEAYAQAQVLDSLERGIRLMADPRKGPEPAPATPTATDPASFTFEEGADGNLTLTGYTGNETDIVIPGEVSGKAVTAIGETAFRDNASLTSVLLPDSLTIIGDGAFAWCVSLRAVPIPRGVTSIGEYAFYHCDSLAEMTIPAGTAIVMNGAFDSCGSLPAIHVGEGNPNYAGQDGVLFDKAMTLLHSYPAGKQSPTYQIPSGVAAIGEDAFSGCENLTEVGIPDSVTAILPSAFYNCFGLAKSVLPKSLISIGNDAFYSCILLTEITIPSSVEEIGVMPFRYCSSLAAIRTEASNPVYASHNGVLFDKAMTVLHAYPAGLQDAAYAVPDGVLSIGENAFSTCMALAGVTLPQGLASIGAQAFDGCAGLKEITIPSSVAFIGEYAFYGCDSLTIRGSAGSYAQTYATMENIPFEATEAGPASPPGKQIQSAFAAQEARDLDGNAFDAEIMLKRPTLVNIWATWCGPCVGEVPALSALSGEYADRINFVGVQLDAVDDSMNADEAALARAREIFESGGNAYPSLIPTQEIMRLVEEMDVQAIPTTWFVDESGHLVWEEVGSNDQEEWRKAIDSILEVMGR